MQEKNTEKKKGLLKKIGILNLIFITLFAGSLLAGAAVVAYMYRNIPTHTNGEHMKELPWTGNEIVIRNIECGWADVSEREWMVMKGVTHTPFVNINIDGSTGSGTLYVKFRNSDGYYCGEVAAIQYRNGVFENIDRQYYQASGSQATAYAVNVFKGTNIVSETGQFLQHFNNARSKHWKVEISYLPDNSDSKKPYPLGYSTIKKELYKANKQ